MTGNLFYDPRNSIVLHTTAFRSDANIYKVLVDVITTFLLILEIVTRNYNAKMIISLGLK